MWLIQICIASFWLYMGTIFLFRQSMFWTSVQNIEWFRNQFGDSTTRKWEKFCRDIGILSMAAACLLFITLPYGVGVLGVIVGFLPFAFLL